LPTSQLLYIDLHVLHPRLGLEIESQGALLQAATDEEGAHGQGPDPVGPGFQVDRSGPPVLLVDRKLLLLPPGNFLKFAHLTRLSHRLVWAPSLEMAR